MVWVLGSVVVGLGSLVWWASVSVSGGCCAVVGLSYCLERGHVLARVDVVSQLFDSSLHVGFRNYQSSPTRRARTENKKVNDHSRSSVNTREVSEGSMGGVSH